MCLAISREERQFIYAWFNAMLARELSDEQLNALQAGQFDDFFAFLAELGFQQEVAKFQAELTACKQFAYPHLELAADYAQLFLLEGNISAIPYASAYLQGEALAQNLAEMDRLLDEFGLEVNRDTKEPSDHICIYLTLLDRLIAQPPLAAQQFLRQQLISWLPAWFAKVKTVKTKSGFYPALLGIFEAVLMCELT